MEVISARATGSTSDGAGRVCKHKSAPINLEVPPHRCLGETRLPIGDDGAAWHRTGAMFFRLLRDDARAACNGLLADQEGGEALLARREHEPDAGCNRQALGQLGAPILRRAGAPLPARGWPLATNTCVCCPRQGPLDGLSVLWRDRLR